MLKHGIHVIGLGIAIPITLSEDARKALSQCAVVIGWRRHKQLIAPYMNTEAMQFIEVLKLSELKEYLTKNLKIPLAQDGAIKHASQIAVLASGDPLYYGIGRWFSRNFPAQSLTFHPAISSIQVACHHHGLALQDTQVVSLHGRPKQTIRRFLTKNRYLLILTDRHSHPRYIANECIAAGFNRSQISVYEKLGYPSQKIQHFSVSELTQPSLANHCFDELHVTIVHVLGDGGVYPEYPGIPDRCYATGQAPGKGMITKREVRLTIASLMQVSDTDIVWDIGAGCGGVSVELSYWHSHATVYAIEHHQQRLALLADNIDFFGVVDNCHIIAGRAPSALQDLPSPDKIFIGGSDGQLAELLSIAWSKLPAGGILVASAVTQATRDQLHAFAKALANEPRHFDCNPDSNGDQYRSYEPANIEMVELAVKRGQWTDHTFSYEQKLPVAVFKFTKPLIDTKQSVSSVLEKDSKQELRL